ncbi:hypothetical protein [Shouchella miscanthi]|uniref:hypothetical protein n=1 Tax=Shouchella miscanthi TaxID=2598861 RepID=UPI0016438F53|nr:hypothetical protein [Shouchella miscanthi]
MAKTELTLQLERAIYKATIKQGTFGGFEVTIGWFGKERVDYMTYDTKGVWRCYEIKVSVADFRSKAKKTFVGHLNYYVMTEELFDKVKDEIPPGIGVYVHGWCKKRARKQELLIDEQVLKDSMIRSLAREAEKLFNGNDPDFVNYMNRRISYERSQYERMRDEYSNYRREVEEKYGRRWNRQEMKQC